MEGVGTTMSEYTFRAGFDVYSPKLRAPYLDNYVMGASGSAIIKISLGMWRFGSYFFGFLGIIIVV